MLQDKDIALDFMEGSKTTVMDLTRSAVEATNPQLKQLLIQMRNQSEQTHEEIYHIAERTGGYISAETASQQDLQRVGQFFQQNMVKDAVGTQQYGSTYQDYSFQNNYGVTGSSGQYQRGSGYYENINPLQNQGSQYYRNK